MGSGALYRQDPQSGLFAKSFYTASWKLWIWLDDGLRLWQKTGGAWGWYLRVCFFYSTGSRGADLYHRARKSAFACGTGENSSRYQCLAEWQALYHPVCKSGYSARQQRAEAI